ncbi:MAG: hypothetical protein K9M03_02840 [Kiritimatiellales bacterium]|nr:hypothetical protein [Kiritimatiellales bacterium]
MKNLLIRTSAASLALTLLPATGFAYYFSQFNLQNLLDDTETAEELQDQKWDTQCRDQLGIPGGDPIGAIKFNLNRCINTQRRQAALMERNKARAIRKIKLMQAKDSQEVNAQRFQRTTFTQSSIRTRARSTSTLPQTSIQQQRSFEHIRSRNRVAVQAKEQTIRRAENNRSMYIKEARTQCADLYGKERTTCINEKLKEFINAPDEEG